VTAIQGGGNASARSGSREARPGAEPWPSLAWQAPRRSAERRAVSGEAAAASDDAANGWCACRRSASLLCSGGIGLDLGMAWQNSGADASRERDRRANPRCSCGKPAGGRDKRGARYRALAPCGRGLRRRCNMRNWVRGCGPDPSPVCGLCEAEQPSPARGEGARGCAARMKAPIRPRYPGRLKTAPSNNEFLRTNGITSHEQR
jgi:hypothetical protein